MEEYFALKLGGAICSGAEKSIYFGTRGAISSAFPLIEVIVLDEKKDILPEQFKVVEQAIYFHHELNINIEGIEVICNLLKQIIDLQQALNAAKNKYGLFDLE